MEITPPDPTLDDTASSIGYSDSGAGNLTSGAVTSNSWFVWDCNFKPHNTYTETFTAINGAPTYPTGNKYNEKTGIYTEYEVVNSSYNSY